MYFCLLQKLGWGWRGSVCFSSSLGWCCFLIKLSSPLEMWVDKWSFNITAWQSIISLSSDRVSSSGSDPVCGRPLLRHRPGADVQVLLPETQSESHQLLPGGGAGGPDRLADYWSRSGDLRFLPFIQVSSNAKKSVSSLSRIRIIFIFISLFVTEDSSRWRWASSDEYPCSDLCSVYQGSVE